MSVIKRRQFLRATLATAPAALLPYGSLFAATDTTPANDVEAVTSTGQQIILKGADVRDFSARLRGELLRRESDGYDSARRVWNGSFDRHPALIARCTGAADVVEAVKFAAASQLLVSVRGGGHSLSGQSVCEKGLMIDLSQMNGVRIDPARRVASVEGGALLGALDREALALGLATTTGTVSHTGVGGLTLGGGIGRLARRFGMTCDNVRAFDLVTADGKFRGVDAKQSPDLFWALRGGGGNFGIATSFEFQLHAFDPVVLGGDLVYSFEDAPAVLKHYLEFATHAPEEFYVEATLVRLPNDQRVLILGFCYSGKVEYGEKAIAPFRQIRKPLQDSVAPMPYVQVQASGDELSAHGHKYYIKGGFIQKATPALADVLLATIAEANLPAVQAVTLPPLGGAVGRVKPAATAFAQRAAEYGVFLFCRWDDAALSAPVGEWARSAFARIAPHTRGFYVNEFNAEDATRLQETYGANFARLVDLKTKYDPDNFFRLNANVAPKAP